MNVPRPALVRRLPIYLGIRVVVLAVSYMRLGYMEDPVKIAEVVHHVLDQRWLRFLVRGTRQENAIMAAVDQAGNRVARYRMRNAGSSAPTFDITIHLDRELTDELILAIATSASLVGSYFVSAKAA